MNLLQFFIYAITLKSSFSNVLELSSSTTNSEFDVFQSTTQFQINSTSDQLMTGPIVRESGLFKETRNYIFDK